MPDTDVLGKNVIAYMKVGDTFFPIFCATVNEFNSDQDEIETTHVNSGPNREFVPGMGGATLSVTGITAAINDSRVAITYLVQQSVRRLIHTLRLIITDQVLPTPNAVVMTFQAFIRTTGISSPKSAFSTGNATFRITGGIQYDTVIPEPEVPACEVQDPLYLEFPDGDTSVQDDTLIQVSGQVITILEVQREGTGFDQTSGTPGNRQFKYDSTLGTISFATSNPSNGETVYVLYKIQEV